MPVCRKNKLFCLLAKNYYFSKYQVILHTELERKLPRMLLERVDKMEIIEYPNDFKCKRHTFDSIFRKWFCNPFSEDYSEESESTSSLQAAAYNLVKIQEQTLINKSKHGKH